MNISRGHGDERESDVGLRAGGTGLGPIMITDAKLHTIPASTQTAFS